MKPWFSSLAFGFVLLSTVLFPAGSHATSADLQESQDMEIAPGDMEAAREDLDRNPPRVNIDDGDLQLNPKEMDNARRDLDQNPPTTESLSQDLEFNPNEMEKARRDLDRNPPVIDGDARDLQLQPGEMNAVRNDLDQPIPGRLLDVRDMQVSPGEAHAVSEDMRNATHQLRRDASDTDDLSLETTDDGFVVRNPRWEFGLRVGRWLPTQAGESNLSVRDVADVLLFNGSQFYAPVVGTSVVRAKLNPATVIEVDGYGPLSKHFSLGLEWGLEVDHEDAVQEPGFYNDPSRYQLDYHTSTMHITPDVKYTQKWGPVSAYIVGGFGWYALTQKLDVTLVDLFEGSNVTASLINDTDNYLGANAGGGLLWRVMPDLSFGADLRYHQIFGSDVDIRALVPTAQLSFVF